VPTGPMRSSSEGLVGTLDEATGAGGVCVGRVCRGLINRHMRNRRILTDAAKTGREAAGRTGGRDAAGGGGGAGAGAAAAGASSPHASSGAVVLLSTDRPYSDAADAAGLGAPKPGRGAVGGGGAFAGVGPLRSVLMSGLPMGV
jgi:hypothetical protein